MILDERLEFADAVALDTADTDMDLVGDVIDLEAVTGQDIGMGEDLYLVIQVTTAVTSAGAATVQFHLLSDAAAAIAMDGSATEHFATDAIAKATLVAGYEACAIRLPKGDYERYLGVAATVGTAALTAGAINAFITKNPQGYKSYPKGYSD